MSAPLLSNVPRQSSSARLAIIGGGIVGLATAWQAQQTFPNLQITLLEKDPELAFHQTGRNSGVIHSGIYYQPGSMKARTCKLGKQRLEEFCRQNKIPFQLCGKVIIATEQSQLPALKSIYERGQLNDVECQWQTAEQIQQHEPYVRCIEGIWVKQAGIVNYKRVAEKLAEQITQAGGEIRCSQQVQQIEQSTTEVCVTTQNDQITADYVIACGGLHSDHLVQQTGLQPPHRIVPFRGEYYRLKPQGNHLCRGLIYPVPDPRFPFLGVHFTRTMEGDILCGPNAVLATSREGYSRTDFSISEMSGLWKHSGFRQLVSRYWKMGLSEMQRSLSKSSFTKSLQALVPGVTRQLLEPAPSGIRAQAIRPNGELIDDFELLTTDRIIHVCNAPSPAATDSLQIGNEIVEALGKRL